MKIDRLLAIVILLINKKQVTAKELAKDFEVSRRTIYRDIDTLNKAGIPIYTSKGVNGGIKILDNYKMNKNMFKPEEIKTLIKALEGMNKSLEDSNLKNTLEKLKGFDDKQEKEREELIIDYSPWESKKGMKNKINLIKRAIKKDEIIEFSYLNSKNIKSNRELEPMTLILKRYTWYLYGYCLLRKDFRIFKVSRIRNLNITKKTFRRKIGNPNEILSPQNIKEDQMIKIKLKINKDYLFRAYEYFEEDDFKIQNDGSAIIESKIWDNEWLYNYLIGLGDHMEVLEPKKVREKLKRRIRKIAKRYL